MLVYQFKESYRIHLRLRLFKTLFAKLTQGV
jgi:hypothetical protein